LQNFNNSLNINNLIITNIKQVKQLDFSGFNSDELKQIFRHIKQSFVKRELVSAIGKLRNLKFKSFLYSVLTNEDPKIVIQAIRALSSLKDQDIWHELAKYQNHPNELVKNYLLNLLSKQQKNQNKVTAKIVKIHTD